MNWAYVIGFLVLFWMFYSLLDRICTCVERCATARAICNCGNSNAKMRLDGFAGNLDEFLAKIGENEEKSDGKEGSEEGFGGEKGQKNGSN